MSSLFPAPLEVLQAIIDSPEEFRVAFWETARHSFWGLGLSFLLGSGLSLILSLSDVLKKVFLPLSVFFQTVPIIAIAPLLVIYFGYGAPTVMAASFIVSFFPVMASFLLGLQTVDPEKVEFFQIAGATKFQILFKLRLPNAFLALYSGLRVATGLAIIGTVSGEFVAGSGLGAMIDVSRTAQRIDRVYAALLLLALMGVAALTLLKMVFRFLHRLRPFGPSSQEWT